MRNASNENSHNLHGTKQSNEESWHYNSAEDKEYYLFTEKQTEGMVRKKVEVFSAFSLHSSWKERKIHRLIVTKLQGKLILHGSKHK